MVKRNAWDEVLKKSVRRREKAQRQMVEEIDWFANYATLAVCGRLPHEHPVFPYVERIMPYITAAYEKHCVKRRRKTKRKLN